LNHLDVPLLLGLLALVLAVAKLFAYLAQRIGQPPVLGELIAGVFLGTSVFELVNPQDEVFHFLAELGVVLLLFEIGLETDLRRLVHVGSTSLVVALAGVVLPFALGYLVCRTLEQPPLVAIVAGATLTATSVGITARVLMDLGRLQEPESQVVLGAAVIDDVIGLIILGVVSTLAEGQEVTLGHVAEVTLLAFGFIVVVLLIGSWTIPVALQWLERVPVLGNVTLVGLALTFFLAWLADAVGSAPIIGAFVAGLLLGRTRWGHSFQQGTAEVAHVFVPLFFVAVGAAVNVTVFDPTKPENVDTLRIGSLLIVVAILGKFLAGYAPVWFRGRKVVVGVGMVPRGEVGLIFAQMGLSSRVFDEALYSAATLMVMVTTFLTPPLLRLLYPPRLAPEEVSSATASVSQPCPRRHP
jgi:Kef-type K+ transport system membrane component KefB